MMQELNVQPTPAASEPIRLNCDVAIVGGGVVGATLAAALKDSGLQVLIIEANSLEGAAARERGYALSPLSGNIFEGIGVWDDIFPYIGKYRHIYLSDADDPRIVKFKTADLGTSFLGYVGEHKVLLTALQTFIIQQCSNIRWLSSAHTDRITYRDNDAILTVDVNGQPYEIQSRLVVGADGARSHIRQSAGIQTAGWNYWQSCVTFMITHDAPQNDIAFERFWPYGPMGVLPLTENRCHIVWTAPHAKAQQIAELDEDEFLEKLAVYTGGLLGNLRLTSDRLVFPVQLFQGKQYVRSRLALIGDAAHRCHPVAGQGLNLGIRDAAALAQVLSEAYQRGEDIGQLTVLKRYERWRKLENLAILGFTDFLDRVFSNDWPPLVLLRRFGLWLLRTVPPLKIFALKLMTGFVGRTPFLGKRSNGQRSSQTALP
jgi:2-octaprenyl-6-methoxyphenol hydroxylase